MVIGAIAIGLLTAYYFGLKVGGIASGVALVLFVVATFVPGWALPAYGTVGVGVAGVCWIGPKVQKPSARKTTMFVARRVASKVRHLIRRT